MDGHERDPTEGHRLTLTNREHAFITGVSHVDSFDDQEIVVDTDLGTLTIRGEELHIRQLSLEEGNLAIDGLITAVAYAINRGGRGPKGKSRGLFDRLLR